MSVRVIRSLVIDGIFNGVGGVLSFLPIIVTLFFFLSLLEDSGYMARVAFIMDKLLRKLRLPEEVLCRCLLDLDVRFRELWQVVHCRIASVTAR